MASTGPSPPDDPDSLRPAAVLTIAIAGHRSLDIASEGATALSDATARLCGELLAGCRRIAEQRADLFAEGPLRLRAVTRLANGADLVMARAAFGAGAEIRAVLPYGPELCAADLPDPAAKALFSDLLSDAGHPFELGGEPGLPRSRERASATLVDLSDMLVAFWDGKPDGERGGVAALVQDAVDRRMPVLLLPIDGSGEVAIIDDPDELLLPAVATDLPRIAFANNRDRVLARAFAPPSSAYERRALRDCVAEQAGRRSRRYEYRLLTKLATRAPPSREPAASGTEEWRRAESVAALVSPEAAASISRLAVQHARLDDLAGFYGQRARSGIVLRYALPTIGAILIAAFALLTPQYPLAWVLIQGVITALTIGEATWAAKGRWDERWLDYRTLAERLRCDRFLVPIGIATVRLDAQTSAEDPAWMRWCHRRLQRAAWIGGRVTQAVVEAAASHLVSTEIASQILYHRAATVRFKSLGRRLGWLSYGSVACALAASLLLIAASPREGSLVEALVKVALITLPSVFLSARGLRMEARFELAAARSDQALVALGEVARRLATGPLTFDRLASASRAAASAMILDTVDWRIGVQRSRSPYRPDTATHAGGEEPPSAVQAAPADARQGRVPNQETT